MLRLEEVPNPESKENEILVRVHEAEVTKAKCDLSSFRFPVEWFWLPLRIATGTGIPMRPILGGYFAGEVVSLDKSVKNFKVGDRAFE